MQDSIEGLAEEKCIGWRNEARVEDQSQKNEMRDAVLGDRKRAVERWRDEGREPVFGPVDQPEPEPVAEPEPEPEPEPVVTPPAAPVRVGWLRRLLGKRGSPAE